MLRKLFLSSLLFGCILIIYPSKKENTKLFNFCYPLEKILVRNALNSRKTLSRNAKFLTQNIAKFGFNKTRGALIDKAIYKYKSSKNSFLLSYLPNEIYCLAGYWIEEIKPGTFEAIIYEESKRRINQINDIKDEIERFLNDTNLEYEKINKKINPIFR